MSISKFIKHLANNDYTVPKAPKPVKIDYAYPTTKDYIDSRLNAFNTTPIPLFFRNGVEITKDVNRRIIDFLNSELYKNQLRNKYPGITDAAIDKTIYEQVKNLENTRSYYRDYIDGSSGYMHAVTPDKKSIKEGLIYIRRPDEFIPDRLKTLGPESYSWKGAVERILPSIQFHEGIHATTGGGRFLPQLVNNTDIDFSPKSSLPELRYNYLSHPDEGRANFLGVLDVIRRHSDINNLNNVSDSQWDVLLEQLSGFKNRDANIQTVFENYDKDKIKEILKKVVTITAPIVVASTLQDGDSK